MPEERKKKEKFIVTYDELKFLGLSHGNGGLVCKYINECHRLDEIPQNMIKDKDHVNEVGNCAVGTQSFFPSINKLDKDAALFLLV